MPSGLEIFDASSNLQVGVGTRLLRVLNAEFVSPASGATQTYPEQGSIMVGNELRMDTTAGDAQVVTVSGGTVTWSSGQSTTNVVMVY